MSDESTGLSPYQRRLFFFLSIATFFEGYDFIAITQVLPNLRRELDLSPSAAGMIVGASNAGSVAAYALVNLADRWGRRRVMTITIAGYTLCSALTALAQGPVSFAIAQFFAKMFLIAEWAVALVYAAEEFPAKRRGTMLGIIQACSALGAVICAAVVPLMLKGPLGWRTVYVVGAIPLLLTAFARRSLRESSRFEAANANKPPTDKPLLRIWSTPYAGRVVLVAACWALVYTCSHSAVTFWKEFAVSERGFTDQQVGASVAIAALTSMPLAFGVGKLLDVIGRRKGAAVIITTLSASCALAYTLHDRTPLTIALLFAIFSSTAVLSVMNAVTAELFPTELRGDGFAWANNLLGRLGYVLSPLAIGHFAETYGWGPSVAVTSVFPMIALAIILARVPETRGKELEEIAHT